MSARYKQLVGVQVRDAGALADGEGELEARPDSTFQLNEVFICRMSCGMSSSDDTFDSTMTKRVSQVVR